MSNKAIKLTETVSITDSISITTSLSPLIYREEFAKYRDTAFVGGGDKFLVFSYILLQLYLENHFHYFLRLLVGGGLGPRVLIQGWNEKDYADQKLEKLRRYLTSVNIKFTDSEFDFLLEAFRNISSIRNKFAHGHPVTKKMGSGIIEQSEAKDYLEIAKLRDTILLANQIVTSWNRILAELQEQENLLKASGLPSKSFLGDCKLEEF